MRLIDADELLGKTINNPLHVPYITKEDVINMPSALNNQVNLCDSCTYTYPECPSEKYEVIFGNGIGNDNICACNKYQPTIRSEPHKSEWIPHKSIFGGLGERVYTCNQCGYNIGFHTENFCPHCGARMKGVKHEND